jgi:hypothetical protein
VPLLSLHPGTSDRGHTRAGQGQTPAFTWHNGQLGWVGRNPLAAGHLPQRTAPPPVSAAARVPSSPTALAEVIRNRQDGALSYEACSGKSTPHGNRQTAFPAQGPPQSPPSQGTHAEPAGNPRLTQSVSVRHSSQLTVPTELAQNGAPPVVRAHQHLALLQIVMSGVTG